jgi:hypothetical protein
MMALKFSVDFGFALSCFMGGSICLAVLLWLFPLSRGREKSGSLDPRHVWVCSVCTYNYVNTREDSISSCPRCGSYNKR